MGKKEINYKEKKRLLWLKWKATFNYVLAEKENYQDRTLWLRLMWKATFDYDLGEKEAKLQRNQNYQEQSLLFDYDLTFLLRITQN